MPSRFLYAIVWSEWEAGRQTRARESGLLESCGHKLSRLIDAMDWGFPVGDWPWTCPGPFAFQGGPPLSQVSAHFVVVRMGRHRQPAPCAVTHPDSVCRYYRPDTMSKTEVPITREVLEWAIDESGFTPEELADEAGIDSSLLMQWVAGEARPGVTELRALAKVLRRPVATFLLPTRPKTTRPQVQFRHLPGQDARPLSPVELRYLRKANRLQHMAEWISKELREPPPQVPIVSLSDDPVETAQRMRRRLGIEDREQLAWTSASVAFDAWREAVESLGITVLQLQLGADSCRGFSIWNDAAPGIAVSTAWNDEARTFTLLHELGHLITRTSSACTSGNPAGTSGAWDPAERWCERFAAVVLIPGAMARRLIAERFGDSPDVSVATVRWLAGKFRASLRAVAIRLIELGLAGWDLYRELPTAGDQKRRGGGGGKGRDRQEIQEDQLGGRAVDLFVRAVEADVVSRTEALSYLDVTDSALESLTVNRA